MRALAALILAAPVLFIAAPAAAQDGSNDQPTGLKRRTVEDAQRFFTRLGEQGAVYGFLADSSEGQIQIAGIEPAGTCRTIIRLRPETLKWLFDDSRAKHKNWQVPATITLNWETNDQVEVSGKAKIVADGKVEAPIYGLKLEQDWLPTWGYLLFDQAPAMAERALQAAKFLSEKCQYQSDTGF